MDNPDQELNRYAVAKLDKFSRDIMSITGLDFQKSQQLISLLHSDDSALSIEAALRQVGVDTTNTKLVTEFINYWEFADTDERS